MEVVGVERTGIAGEQVPAALEPGGNGEQGEWRAGR
ncbi:MAG: hypothetical protein H6Q01_408, partial [Acidobacteria bacterium]|nr:hypothetical protein [Acidobacteriota bacterium]